MNKKLSFAIENAEIIDTIDKSQFALCKIEAFNSGLSKHNTLCSPEVLKNTAPTIFEKPIVFQFDDLLGDFGSHSKDPINAGFVIPNSAEFIERPDGRTALVVMAKIWKRYSKNFLEVFQNTGKSKKAVSVELEILDAIEKSNGELDILDLAYCAICALGDLVTEASPGSNLQMLSFSVEKENEEYQKIYKIEFSSKYNDIDLTIPKEVKDNCNEALTIFGDVENNGKVYANPIALATARYLSRNEKLTFDKLKTFQKRMPKNIDESDIVYLLWGGDEGKNWFLNIANQINTIDNKEMSYFSENVEKNKNEIIKNDKEDISVDENMGIKEKDEEMAVVEDAVSKMAEEVSEDKEIEDAKKMAFDTSKDEKEESPKEEKSESPEKEKQEDKNDVEKKFSLSAWADIAAILAFLEAESQDAEDIADMCQMAVSDMKEKGEFADKDIVAKGMYAAMCKMATKIKVMADDKDVYMDENMSLKEFKANVEGQRKEFEINQIFAELSEKVIIPDDAMTEMREKALDFSLPDINGWKNWCKSKAFDFAIRVKTEEKSEDDNIVRFGGVSFVPTIVTYSEPEFIWSV